MKIEIWSDFVCPYCYIGKRQLDMALENFSYRDHVFIQFKSYQLDSNADVKTDKSYHQLLSEKYDRPIDQVMESNERLREQAAQLGLQFNFDEVQYSNTFDAHRLLKYAIKSRKGSELAEKLFRAYFAGAQHLGDHLTLLEIAEQVGLKRAEAIEVLKTRKYSNAVREDIELATDLGVEGVPFFVFNEKYALAGSQPLDVFHEVLTTVWEEERTGEGIQSMQPQKTSYCSGDDYCEKDD